MSSPGETRGRASGSPSGTAHTPAADAVPSSEGDGWVLVVRRLAVKAAKDALRERGWLDRYKVEGGGGDSLLYRG